MKHHRLWVITVWKENTCCTCARTCVNSSQSHGFNRRLCFRCAIDGFHKFCQLYLWNSPLWSHLCWPASDLNGPGGVKFEWGGHLCVRACLASWVCVPLVCLAHRVNTAQANWISRLPQGLPYDPWKTPGHTHEFVRQTTAQFSLHDLAVSGRSKINRTL